MQKTKCVRCGKMFQTKRRRSLCSKCKYEKAMAGYDKTIFAEIISQEMVNYLHQSGPSSISILVTSSVTGGEK